jgi:hypothetical protein
MARETKAERLAREAAEKLVQQAAQAATYPQRLMALLERAQNVNFKLTVKGGEFLLEDRDDSSAGYTALTLTYDHQSEEAIQELDWRVEMKEEAEREAQRRVLVRNQALNKLSLEEREILGLM